MSHAYGSYQWLLSEVGRFRGYKASGWDASTLSILDSNVQRGVKRFYTPPVLPGERYAHEWSFLRPVVPIPTVAGVSVYALPADFASADSPLTIAPGSSVLHKPIEIVPEYEIRWRLSLDASTGVPEFCATRPMAHDATMGTRYEILFYPTPNGIYAISARCRINPMLLDAENNMPYGGDPHYETILQSCLAVAESSMDGGSGQQLAEFMQKLAASVSHDRKFACPPGLGCNRDRSDVPVADLWHERGQNIITYKGLTS